MVEAHAMSPPVPIVYFPTIHANPPVLFLDTPTGRLRFASQRLKWNSGSSASDASSTIRRMSGVSYVSLLPRLPGVSCNGERSVYVLCGSPTCDRATGSTPRLAKEDGFRGSC